MATYTYQTTAKAYMNHPSGHPFMTATEARNKARSDSTILHEIRLMEQKIMIGNLLSKQVDWMVHGLHQKSIMYFVLGIMVKN